MIISCNASTFVHFFLCHYCSFISPRASHVMSRSLQEMQHRTKKGMNNNSWNGNFPAGRHEMVNFVGRGRNVEDCTKYYFNYHNDRLFCTLNTQSVLESICNAQCLCPRKSKIVLSKIYLQQQQQRVMFATTRITWPIGRSVLLSSDDLSSALIPDLDSCCCARKCVLRKCELNGALKNPIWSTRLKMVTGEYLLRQKWRRRRQVMRLSFQLFDG